MILHPLLKLVREVEASRARKLHPRTKAMLNVKEHENQKKHFKCALQLGSENMKENVAANQMRISTRISSSFKMYHLVTT